MQPAKNWARACQQSTESHPQNEHRMHEEDGSREGTIEIRSKKDCMHIWNLQQRGPTIGLTHIHSALAPE
jgi:hypothetical protein